jgi:PAS domain S-box-containing protein
MESRSVHELADFIERLSKTIAASPSSEAVAELGTALEELKVAEEALNEQTEAVSAALQRVEQERRRYVELFEFAPDGYGVSDRHGVILEANLALCELLGDSAQKVIGTPLPLFVIPEQRTEIRTFMSRVLQSPPNVPEDHRRVWRTEFFIDRHPRLLVSARCRVSHESAEDVPRLLLLLRDVTDQRRAEEALKHNERHLKKAVDEKTTELQERLNELERFHDLTVDRELRLIELEGKIKSLESRLTQTDDTASPGT